MVECWVELCLLERSTVLVTPGDVDASLRHFVIYDHSIHFFPSMSRPITPVTLQQLMSRVTIPGYNFNMPTMKEFTAAYDVKPNTVRRWTKEFADFLDAGANPSKGDRRRYNESDAQVIDLIATMRADNQTSETIRARLAAGDRGQWPPEGHEGAENDARQQEMRRVLQSPEIAQMTIQVANLEGQLSAVNELNDKLLDQLQDANERIIETQTQLRLLQQGSEAAPPAAEEPEPEPAKPETEKRSPWRQRLASWISGEG